MNLRGIFTQAPPEVPRFPYFVLVRLPLLTLMGLLLTFFAAIAYTQLEVQPGRVSSVIAVSLSLCVVVVGLLQIAAVPFGLWVLLGIERWTSPHHWMAVICGSVHFCFCLYYVYASIFSPKY
jgi:hypothetical protein